MADKIISIHPAPEGTQIAYLKDDVDFTDDNWCAATAYNVCSCRFIALVERGKEQKVTALDLNPETGNLEVPGEDSGYAGIIFPDTQMGEGLGGYYEIAKAKYRKL
jgi:hypothetical protein